MTLMTHALAVNPSSLAANNFLGFYYDQLNPPDLAKAAMFYQRALADHPNVGWVHFNVARFFTRAGQFDAAIQQYRQAIALDSGNEDAFLNYGAALASRGRDEEAMAAFGGALRLDPNDARVYENIGIIWANRGDIVQARRSFMMALHFDPNRPVSAEYLRAHPVNPP
jgi:Tfp pilus assembly protein PilF